MEKLGLTSKLKGFNINNNSNDILGIDKLKSVKVEKIKIEKLVPYKDHLFKLYEGDRLKDMIESIKEFGVINPIIVKPQDEFYMILSGHNRTNAAKLAGLKEMPAIIKDNISDEEAILIVTETNLMQRSFSDMLHSEKAATLRIQSKAERLDKNKVLSIISGSDNKLENKKENQLFLDKKKSY